MTKTIPARVVFFCDVCRKEVAVRRYSGKLSLDKDGLDYQGMPVGPGGVSYDLCDECVNCFNDIIQATIETIRNPLPLCAICKSSMFRGSEDKTGLAHKACADREMS